MATSMNASVSLSITHASKGGKTTPGETLKPKQTHIRIQYLT